MTLKSMDMRYKELYDYLKAREHITGTRMYISYYEEHGEYSPSMYEFGMLLRRKIWEDEKFGNSQLQNETDPVIDADS